MDNNIGASRNRFSGIWAEFTRSLEEHNEQLLRDLTENWQVFRKYSMIRSRRAQSSPVATLRRMILLLIERFAAKLAGRCSKHLRKKSSAKSPTVEL
jgi:hypothetical protein